MYLDWKKNLRRFGWTFFWVTSPAYGRFLDHDADVIDRESQILHENHNDKASYRAPIVWERRWDAGTIGWRASAGSLNINRFDYQEDIKFQANDGNFPVAISYQQLRREDMTEDRLEREIRLDLKLSSWWSVAWLGDGGHRKEYGDMGAALSMRPAPGLRELEIYYWDPDLYYATKKPYAEDRMVQRTHTTGARMRWSQAAFRVFADLGHDWPLVWQRSSRGYRYEFERRYATWRCEWTQAAWSTYARGMHEHKRERKAWGAENQITHSQAMDRQIDEVEVGTVHSSAGHDRTLALQLVRRHADYRFIDWRLEGVPDPLEPGESGRWRLHDRGLYLTDHFPISAVSQQHFLQLGIISNWVQEDFEMKLQTAYDLRIGKNGGLLLNATWDIDRLFTTQPFRPWGGGNIQMFVLL